ncbi:MAG: Co2+/Mg2+ efflux protein ApaG [Gemmatimonadetes bacterium]|nr:Co2+/Mg2+ efflux protein ApaG [Gemmatimonadota bacterium]
MAQDNKPAPHPPDLLRRPPILAGRFRVSVRSVFAREESNPPWSYVFVYFIRIENLGDTDAQLFWRHWKIHDPVAGDHEVEGEGVVGESPVIPPRGSHSYSSYCVLRGAYGHMEGYYHFRETDGKLFRAVIPRFELVAEDASQPIQA